MITKNGLLIFLRVIYTVCCANISVSFHQDAALFGNATNSQGGNLLNSSAIFNTSYKKVVAHCGLFAYGIR